MSQQVGYDTRRSDEAAVLVQHNGRERPRSRSELKQHLHSFAKSVASGASGGNNTDELAELGLV